MKELQTQKSEEVKWEINETTVYGTITRPQGAAPCPGVVFVAGSGPTDRNWCSPLLPGTNCSGRLLADVLTNHGFVTLRYDKRAAGPHALENLPRLLGKMSMQGHADEVAGAVSVLAGQPDVDISRLSVLTSSEGALHALHYQLGATDLRFKNLVLTGAPGRAVGAVAREQISAQVAVLPNKNEIMTHYDNCIAAFIAGEPMVPDASLPEGVKNLLLSLTAPTNLPFARELWLENPADLIAGVSEPILVVIGKKDIQVDWRSDGAALEAATAKNGNATFAYPENADHVLKHEEQPRNKLVAADVATRYNADDRVLDPSAC
ncbi:MAG: alpha/beta hydrolase family protein, partial [Halobacteriota archaeon]